MDRNKDYIEVIKKLSGVIIENEKNNYLAISMFTCKVYSLLESLGLSQ